MIHCCCCCSVAKSCSTLCTLWTAARQASLSFTISLSLLKFESVAIQPSYCLSSSSPLALNTRHQDLFQCIGSSHQVARVLELQHQFFQFRVDLLIVQGTLKSLLQHHSSKTSIPLRSAFFTVQLSHPYMTTGKTIALTRRTLVSKVMSLLLNMLSR